MTDRTPRRRDSALRVLPTPYAGFVFRSRTEARWAVFLDALDIEWRYEREGLSFKGQGYIPDFLLPTQRKWLEIKGELPTLAELEKAQWVAEETGYDALIAAGEPRLPNDYDDSMWVLGVDLSDYSYWWCECPHCQYVDATFQGRAARLDCRCIVSRDPDQDHVAAWGTPRLVDAYTQARVAFTGPEFRGSAA